MAFISIVPTVDIPSKNMSKFVNLELAIFNGARKVGEAKVVLINYLTMREDGYFLDTVAKRLSEDMHLALSATSKHSLFSYEIVCDTDMMHCRTPIVAYLSRFYIYPEYRGRGYGKEFIQMLPNVIRQITLSRPLAIAVYISPQSKVKTHNGLVADVPKKELRTLSNQMEAMFLKAGYVKPSKALSHKRCMVWTDGKSGS